MASVRVIEDDQRIRETIVATAPDDDAEIVRVPDAGADDYVLKPRANVAGPPEIDPDAPLDRGSSAGGSTGLGRDIARSTTRAAGGNLRIERPPLGGARLVLDLPLAGGHR